MVACLRLHTINGEPSGNHTLWYLAADCLGRVRRITPCSSGFQATGGISTTRGSLRNSAR